MKWVKTCSMLASSRRHFRFERRFSRGHGGKLADPPRAARQLHRRGEQSLGWATAGKEGAVRADGEERRADFFGPVFLFGTAGIRLGVPRRAARPTYSTGQREQWDCAAGRSSRLCPSAPEHSLRRVLGALRRGPPLRSPDDWRRWAPRTPEASRASRDIAVDRRRGPSKGDRRDRRRRIGANPRQLPSKTSSSSGKAPPASAIALAQACRLRTRNDSRARQMPG